MIKKQFLDKTFYECSECGLQVLENSDCCRLCGRFFTQNSVSSSDKWAFDSIPKPVEFNLETLNKSKEGSVYFLKDDWLNMEISVQEKELYYALMPVLRTERFLSYFFKLLNYKLYEEKGKVADKEILLKYFTEGLTRILKDKMKVLLSNEVNPYDEVPTSYEWLPQFNNFGTDLNFFKDAILDKLNFSPELREMIGISPSVNVYQMNEMHLLVQNFMIIAAGHAFQRIRDEINNENYFGIEVIVNQSGKHLLLYQTPAGMLHYNTHFSKFESELRPAERSRMFAEIGLQKLESKKLHSMLDCHSVIAFRNEVYVQHKFTDDNLSSYISNKNNLPFLKSLQADLQVNFQLL